MLIRHTYKFIEDGITKFLCNTDTVPNGELLLTIDVLNAEDGWILINKESGEKNKVVALMNGDVKENYKEIPDKDEEKDNK